MENKQRIALQNKFIKQWGSRVKRDIKSTVASMFPHNVEDETNDNNESLVMSKPAAKTNQHESFVIKNVNQINDRISLHESIRDKYFKHGGEEIDMLTITFSRHGIFVLKGVGKGTRVPKDFLNPTLDKEFPVLADKIGELNADGLLEVMLKKIK